MSGVSKAMISKVERAQSSPTAVLLGKLAAGLGVSLAQLSPRTRRSRNGCASGRRRRSGATPKPAMCAARSPSAARAAAWNWWRSNCRAPRRSAIRDGAARRTGRACGCSRAHCRSTTATSVSNSPRATASTSASTGHWSSRPWGPPPAATCWSPFPID
ncbi:helix-turn-helix domain-containing protein [Variovorax boronicumulans]|uniref:helix-turn-helix domain-containing protein n=1 Tax=Variovorax boronicumulans TaxID=436515 RepID=UPI0036F3E82C